MRKIIIFVAGVAACAPVCVFGTPPFGLIPDWFSADERATVEAALGDFNGDGWQKVVGENSTGDGKQHLFYLKRYPARNINGVRVNGNTIPRGDYCFDARAGWFSLKNAPPKGARVEVDYTWSNRPDFFAGNEVRGNSDGRDVIYFNNGAGLEKAPGWLSQTVDNSYTVAAADFDNDGDVDVAIGGNEFVKIYKNTGGGLENKPSWVYEPKPGGWPAGFAWGDVDNDGYLELAVADIRLDQGRFYVFKNDAGTLESPPFWSVAYEYAADVSWGDVDGDGYTDLAGGTYLNEWGGYTYVFKNEGGNLEKTHCWRNDPPAGMCFALAWGDVNGDGEIDLVKGISNPIKDKYTDIYYSKEGVLPTTPSWESRRWAHCQESILADCDGDGRLDLVQANGSGLMAYFQTGNGLEREPSWRYGGWVTASALVADFNRDGSYDVASGCRTPHGGAENILFLNKGNIGINVKGFTASPCARGVALRWEVSEAAAGFNLFRAVKSARVAAEPGNINKGLITGRSPYRYVDADVSKGVTYQYWLDVVPLSGPAERHGPVECTVKPKAAFALAQNAPNPARAATTVRFSVPAACDATITVYDVAGRKVLTAFAGGARAGENELEVNVSSLAPGVYTYRLEASGAAAAKRMVVVR